MYGIRRLEVIHPNYFHPLYRDAVRFSFGPIIQKELDDFALLWNNHRIRHSRMAEVPHGIPEILYFIPHQSGGSYICELDFG